MQSTSKSNNMILEVKNLEVIYNIKSYVQNELREKFIQLVQDPLHAIMNPYDYLHALKKISFTIKKGERVGLIGANGSGKTTLCRCISGMFQPRGGHINIQGQVRGIFDTSIGILPELTGRENAYLVGEMMYPDLNRVEMKQLVEECLKFSGLGQFLDVPFKTYSKGMQVRFSLSLVSARTTDLLILDEVYDGADQFFCSKISQRILNLIYNSGSVLFVSHGHSEIKDTCNRAILLHKGKIVLDSSPEETLYAYKHISQDQDYTFNQ